MLRCLLLAALLAAVSGCQRPWYRRDADRETYAVEGEHEDESRWPVARTDITPPPGSRLFDPFDPDYPPLPPDDPAAFYYMLHPDGQHPARTYHRDGDAPYIEDPAWRDTLELDKDGSLVLSPDKAVELGILHSREYQQALENLYGVALTLTIDRFEFALHWFGTNNTIFSHFGSSDTEINTLTTNSSLGFTKNFAAGGQLLVDFANSFVFTFSGVNQTNVTSNIGVTFLQPLLRNFGRRVRLETLTQGERDLLYAVRTFARFRKQFYVNLTTAQGRNTGYLGLLFQVQNIRNLESNLTSQEQNLLLHEALFARGTVSTVQVDQAFQSYQQGRLSLIQARSSLETSLDAYKLNLGLPPDLKIRLDDTILNPFQLVDPDLETLQKDLDAIFAEYRKPDNAPPVASLRSGYDRLKVFHKRLVKLTDEVENELEQWKAHPVANPDEPAQVKREQATRENLEGQMPEFRKGLDKMAKDLDSKQAGLTEATRAKDWEGLQTMARRMIADAAQLYVVQTQVRVYLIQLRPIPYTLDQARVYARENRLDLMNQRAQVVDAWRKIEVTASALKAGLDVTATANIATRPFGSNPVDFRSSASQYTVGFAFDSPLNRLAERNAYRESLIVYEQSRRNFMALDDQIQTGVRLDIRNLETDRASFGIARQTLISAARQVEAARDRLLVIPNAADTTGTQDVLNALSALLQAKSTLISSWINYETDLAQLLLDMDALQLDSRGLPDHEPDIAVTPGRPNSRDPKPEQLPAPRPVPPGPPQVPCR
jgi:outer membrane protein TolC